MGKVRVRFAPSPTGPLKLGGARAALFNWLYAKVSGGKLILRSENVDPERSFPEVEQSIMADLTWLGVRWDEGPDVGGPYAPYRQSERQEIYSRFVARLIEDGLAYQCFCSQQELADQRREMLSHGETPRYTGRCRSLTAEDRARLIADGRKPVVRFRIAGGKTVDYSDLIRGSVSIGADGLSDFIIAKTDGLPTYNMTVVLDDHLMGITHVIRGDEHLRNTARQILLYEALGWRPPQFAHLPGLADEDRRLSVTIGVDTIEEYRQRGYLPETLVNFLISLGWNQTNEREIFTLQEVAESFQLDQVTKHPVIFSALKLKEINSVHLKKSTPERVLELILPHLQEAGYVNDPDEMERKWLLQLADAMRGELGEISEITEKAACFFSDDPMPENARARQVLKEEQVPRVFSALQEQLDNIDEFKAPKIRSLLRQLCKDLDLTTRRVYLPIRIALTGALKGPAIFHIIALLGPEKVRVRLEAALRLNHQRV